MSGAKRHEALLLAPTPKLQAILPQGAIVCGEKPVWVVLTSDYDAQVVFADLLAADLRAAEADRDTLRTANQRLEGEYSKLLESNVLDAETIDRLEGEVARLREALNTAKYRIEQGRVWNGMGWSLTGLHPHGQQKALDAIDAALRGNGGDV
jgi:hypothetical protein